MIAIVSLLVIITLSILVTRIAAIALVNTGLSEEIARFQARSAFLGIGFTTQESEYVVNKVARRKIILILMLLGNAGFVTSISSLVLIFTSTAQTTSFYLRIGILLAGLMILLLASYSKWVDDKLSDLIRFVLKRYTQMNIQNYESLLHLSDGYQVSEIKVDSADWFADKTLAEMRLRDEGILVLGIKSKKNEKYIGAPNGETIINPEDTLIIYGRSSLLKTLNKRRKGSNGDKEHDEAVAEQKKIFKAENGES